MHDQRPGSDPPTMPDDLGEVGWSAHPVSRGEHVGQLRPTAPGGLWSAGRRGSLGPLECACATGSRASSPGGGCWAEKCAYSRSNSNGPKGQIVGKAVETALVAPVVAARVVACQRSGGTAGSSTLPEGIAPATVRSPSPLVNRRVRTREGPRRYAAGADGWPPTPPRRFTALATVRIGSAAASSWPCPGLLSTVSVASPASPDRRQRLDLARRRSRCTQDRAARRPLIRAFQRPVSCMHRLWISLCTTWSARSCGTIGTRKRRRP